MENNSITDRVDFSNKIKDKAIILNKYQVNQEQKFKSTDLNGNIFKEIRKDLKKDMTVLK